MREHQPFFRVESRESRVESRENLEGLTVHINHFLLKSVN